MRLKPIEKARAKVKLRQAGLITATRKVQAPVKPQTKWIYTTSRSYRVGNALFKRNDPREVTLEQFEYCMAENSRIGHILFVEHFPQPKKKRSGGARVKLEDLFATLPEDEPKKKQAEDIYALTMDEEPNRGVFDEESDESIFDEDLLTPMGVGAPQQLKAKAMRAKTIKKPGALPGRER